MSEAARPWLELAMAHAGPTLQLATRLRKDLPAERARLVVQQAELRRRAAEKFARADRMFFTPLGLEQSTDQWIAAYKAGRLAESSRSDGGWADLCCGIGGDLLAMAARGPVAGVERDPATAVFAEANRAVCAEIHRGPNSGEVKVVDVAAFDV
ncbi:MAG TPA: hypothetical protein VGH32_10985, partial [Pirellulales bacterium]